jgi:tRNA (cytidine/uridine-2'-O-)-methyltransferase
MDDYYLRRAGLDYWQHLDIEIVDDWLALTQRLPGPPWFFTKTATTAYTQIAFQPRDVLVFGNESQGLPPSLLEDNAERTLRIPIRPEVRSLNLSNAVGIVVYEALRQFGVA